MQEGVQALQDKAANSELLCSGSYPAFDTVIKESYCNEGIEHTDSFSCVVLYCCKLKEHQGSKNYSPLSLLGMVHTCLMYSLTVLS